MFDLFIYLLLFFYLQFPVFRQNSRMQENMCHMNLVLFNPLNAELNLICHLLALLGGATIVVVSRLRLT